MNEEGRSSRTSYDEDPLKDFGGTDLEGCGIPEDQMTQGIPPLVKPYLGPDEQEDLPPKPETGDI